MTELSVASYILYSGGVVNFVETGCCGGNGIQEAVNAGIKNIYSCDINPVMVKMSIDRFKDNNVKIMLSDSENFLKILLPELTGKTVFWLDAHFANFYTENPDFEDIFSWPLFREIKLIKELKKDFEKDIILIDDIHVFEQDNQYYDNNIIKEHSIDCSLMELEKILDYSSIEYIPFDQVILYSYPKEA